MLVVVPPAHTNILLATATQCCLFCCDFQPGLMLLLLTWLLRTSGPQVHMCPPQLLILPLVGMISFMRCKVGKGLCSTALGAHGGQWGRLEHAQI